MLEKKKRKTENQKKRPKKLVSKFLALTERKKNERAEDITKKI